MGKAAKRERQKTNKVLKEEEAQRAQSRAKTFKLIKGIALILIVPIVVVAALYLDNKSDKDTYTAKITVAIDGEKSLPNDGIIEVELDFERAPKSVKHFIGYAKDGKYDGLDWHRVVKDFVIQTGDPLGDGTGDLGSKIQSELPAKGYKQGDIAWAKGGNEAAGTAGSQFFIVTGNNDASGIEALNTKAQQADGTNKYQYGFIGRVTKGLAAAFQIESLAPKTSKDNPSSDGKPTKTTKVLKIEVYKNGKLIKRGDKSFPSAATTTTTTSTTAPAETTTTAAP